MAKVLVVEDEAIVSMMLEDMLVDLGHDVVGTPASVADAMGVLDNEKPDCVILDVNLADEPSYPIAERLERDGIPYAFATGYGKHGVEPVYDDIPVLQKPFDERNLVTVLSKMLKIDA